MSFVRVALEEEITPEAAMRVTCGGRAIALVRIAGGELYAVDDTCTHEEASLAEGLVEGSTIECPRHGARFDLASGEAITLPAVGSLRTYQVKVENGEILVNIT